MKVRINKFLSDQKVCSRRMADRLIREGRVFVNGIPAKIGQKVDPQKDKIEVKGEEEIKKSYKYYIFYKPRGILSHRVEKNQKDAIEVAGLPREFFVVGRLDKESEGLLFITNDGRVVNRLLNPEFAHKREYVVWTNKPVKSAHLKELAKGVNIEGYKTKPAEAEKISDTKIKLVLTEGKKHQIRRMLTALGYQVKRLKRVSIENLDLGSIEPGELKEVKGEMLKKFLSKIFKENK